jgi:hypothetical protein
MKSLSKNGECKGSINLKMIQFEKLKIEDSYLHLSGF